jgi:hypothetical protein
MKITTQRSDLYTQLEGTKSKKVSIQANAKMFEILFSGIYQYKIAAIVRELCTNAYDSHADAGCPEKPFRVVLPNAIHPYFEVEDFGIGMNEEDAFNVYCVMGESTKSERDDVAGAFGLGSKTPFAYKNKQFTVRMRKDGVEITAMMYLDELGGPMMTIVSQVPTIAPNGVLVKIPVAEEDIDEFYAEAAFYLSFFPTTPDVIHPDFRLAYPDAPAAMRETSTWFSATRDRVGMKAAVDGTEIMVTSGPVAYPVSARNIGAEYDEIDLSTRLFGVNTPMFIKTDVSEVRPATSREALQITDESKEILLKRFRDALRDRLQGFYDIANDDSIHPLHRNAILNQKFGTRVKNYVETREMNAFDYIDYGKHVFRANGFKRRKTVRTRSLEFTRARNTSVLASCQPAYIRATENDDENSNIFEFDAAGNRVLSEPLRIMRNNSGIVYKKTIFDEFVPHHFDYIIDYITDATVARLERVFGCKIEVTDYAVYHQMWLDERKKNRKKGVHIRHDNNTFRAGFFKLSRFKMKNSLRVDLASQMLLTVPDDFKGRYYFVDSHDKCVVVGKRRMDTYEFERVLGNRIDPKKVGDDELVYILRRTKINEKKIDALGIPHVDEFIEERGYDFEERSLRRVMQDERFNYTDNFRQLKTIMALDDDIDPFAKKVSARIIELHAEHDTTVSEYQLIGDDYMIAYTNFVMSYLREYWKRKVIEFTHRYPLVMLSAFSRAVDTVADMTVADDDYDDTIDATDADVINAKKLIEHSMNYVIMVNENEKETTNV